ncbi:hypothetical protein [Sneathiella chinensis]|uniref:Uncharacterized protein n=1 Tax=Sneathiella chinensis TaxID=349750 RepID=A0ABQ5U8T1_9PROT|nr:hypothetical protein [Sneathiella chinensis]GLQ07600.1 hypothetical protein GCM10007924_28210 [Sneathiella chinensis]
MNRTHILRNLGFLSQLDRFLLNVPALAALTDFAQIQFIVEKWQGDRVTLHGEVILDTENAVELLGVQVVFGQVVGDPLRIPFVIETAAFPVYAVLTALAVASGQLDLEAVAEQLADEDLQDPDELFRRYDTDFGDITVSFGPVPVQLVIGGDYLTVGRHVTDATGQSVAVEPDPAAGPLRIPLGNATVTAGRAGLAVGFDGEDSFTLPPLMLDGTGLAIELKALTVKLADGPVPNSVAALGADKGFDESWRGVFAEEVTVWNLDRVFPGGPEQDAAAAAHARLTATGFAIDARGLTGTVGWQRTPAAGDVLSLKTVEIGFDRTWYPLTAKAGGQVSLDPLDGGIVGYEARLELDPFAEVSARWRLMLALTDQSPGGPVVAIDNPPAALGGTLTAAAAMLGEGDLALLFGALSAGQAADLLSWDRLALTQATMEGTLRADGFDLLASLGFEMDAELQVMDDPVPLSLMAGDVKLSYRTGEGFSSDWKLSDRLDLAVPLDVDIGGQATLERLTLRRRDDGALVIELGVETDGTGDLMIGGLPNVVSLVYHPGPPPRFTVELKRDGQELTLLVPGVLYAKGSLQRSDEAFPQVGELSWGDTLRAALTAYLVGDGRATLPKHHLEKEYYLFALDFGLLTSTREDGLKALVLSGDLSFKPGIPLGATGTALYGMGLTYAQNARPDTEDGDYPGWFLRTDPAFTTHASKWLPKGDHWGFGASVSLGSQPDDGRSWNVTAGLFLLLPGPVIGITGKGSLFAPPPPLPAGGTGRSVNAPFAAAISLDLLNDRLKAELTADIEVAAGGTSLLELYVPAKVDASLGAPLDMSLSVGQYQPMDARVVGKALSLYEVTSYIMATTQGIEDFPQPGINLPGFAMAYGGSGGLSVGFSSAIAELKLSVHAGFDLGVSLASPPMMVGQVFIDGSLVARLACVMVNMGIRTELMVVAPDPFELSGKARISVGLPWPLPDINFSGDFRLGAKTRWPDDYHYPDNPISDISLFPRPQGTAQLFQGDSFDGQVIDEAGAVTGVPVDAGLLVAFRTSVGNLHPVVGDVKTQADDAADPVWEVATTGRTNDGRTVRNGWRHIVTDIRIREAGQPKTIPGGWAFKGVAGTTDGSVNQASGGQAVRNTLTLMAPLDAPVERRYGTGAEVLGEAIASWRACEIVPSPKELGVAHTVPDPRTFGIERLLPRSPAYLLADQWYRLKRHAPEPGPDIRVSYQPPSAGNTAFLANFDLLRSMILTRPQDLRFRVPAPLQSQKFVLTVPTAVFARDNDMQKAFQRGAGMQAPAGVLQLHVPAGGNGRSMYFALRRGVVLDVRDEKGAGLEVEAIFNSTLVINPGEIWEVRRLHLPVGIETLNVSAFQSRSVGNGTLGFYGALMLGAEWYMDFQTRQEAVQRKQEATVEMITELCGQSANWSSGGAAGLLQPDTDYEIEVTVQTHHARQYDDGPLEIAAEFKTFTRRGRFRTEADIRHPLRGRSPAPVWAPDDPDPWVVDTVPARGQCHYRQNALQVAFADALTAGRIAAHQRQLQLKLTHESGQSLQERADILLSEKKEELSRLQDIVSDYLEGQPCLNLQDPVWISLIHRFNTLLEPGAYLAELVAGDAAGQRPAVTLHEWRFLASRWLTLEDHMEAHAVKPIPEPGIAAERILHMSGRLSNGAFFREDDGLLDGLLYEDLGLSPFASPDSPEMQIRVFEDGVAAILLDGPEPLLGEEMQIEVRQNAHVQAISAIVSNVARTRALVCMTQPIAPGPITLHVTAEGRQHVLQANVPELNELLEAL